MIDRRRFLKLCAGGVAAAATARLPLLALASPPLLGVDDTAAMVLRPVGVRCADTDGDFAHSLMGLLVNSRTRAFNGTSSDV